MNPTTTTTKIGARRPAARQLAVLAIGALAVLAALTAGADDALAANSATDVGRNLGGLLKEWATWLFGGATAMIAVSHLGRRDVAGALVFAGMAILVGGFVLAGPEVATFIKGVYQFADTGR
jgi:hypothetical protein